MTPEELIAAASPKIRDVGSAFYFAPETLAKGKELGLDGLRFYMIGRGGVLGDVEPAVVGSAFGYFAPALIEKTWTSAREKVAPMILLSRPEQLRHLARVHVEEAGRAGRWLALGEGIGVLRNPVISWQEAHGTPPPPRVRW